MENFMMVVKKLLDKIKNKYFNYLLIIGAILFAFIVPIGVEKGIVEKSFDKLIDFTVWIFPHKLLYNWDLVLSVLALAGFINWQRFIFFMRKNYAHKHSQLKSLLLNSISFGYFWAFIILMAYTVQYDRTATLLVWGITPFFIASFAITHWVSNFKYHKK